MLQLAVHVTINLKCYNLLEMLQLTWNVTINCLTKPLPCSTKAFSKASFLLLLKTDIHLKYQNHLEPFLAYRVYIENK
jgi:hypothetical protein